jgi:hypothetical protein
MDMPPSGWYPDPYGVPDLLRWWDGSTWTQHTHNGSAPGPSDGPATMLDATRIAAVPGAAGGGAPRTTIQRAVGVGEATMIGRTTVQPSVAASQPYQPTAVQPPMTAAQPGTALQQPYTGSSWPHAGPQQGANPSWPNAGPPPGSNPSWPNAGPEGRTEFGTQVLPPVLDDYGPDDYGTQASRFGHYRDQRRHRMLLGGILAGGTAVALGLIALVASNLTSGPPAAPAAAQSQALPATTALAPSAAQSTTQPPAATPSVATASGTVTDSVSGLSYSMLSTPWNNGCPSGMSNQQTLTWTAGEQATAGQFTNNGQQTTWYAEACSAPLPQQFGYNGVQDLPNITTNLVSQFDGPYYGALSHQRTQLLNQPVSVSGHAGWEVKYLETYPDASSMGLPFNSEEGAVVVVDQGTGLPPAVFFVSITSNLGVPDVDVLVSSLQLSATQTAGQPSATQTPGQPSATQTAGNPGQPGNGQPGGGGGNGGGGNNP